MIQRLFHDTLCLSVKSGLSLKCFDLLLSSYLVAVSSKHIATLVIKV